MNAPFFTTTHAKCIIAGEHTVIRGGPALVFPVKSCQLTLHYTPEEGECRAEFTGPYRDDLHLLFWSVLEHGFEIAGRHMQNIQGHFTVDNRIPVGAGLGASAALCVALTRWFLDKNMIAESEFFAFAKRLEDLFHHKSSGLDIAAVMSDRPIQFQQGIAEPLTLNWQPHWKLSYSEQIGRTSHCVKKVNELIARDPSLGQHIDHMMQDAVEQARIALQQTTPDGIDTLAKAMNQTRTCFTQWGLAGGRIESHMNDLLSQGALAAKPTGSGDGGYVLSLWPTEATLPQSIEFIHLN